MPPQRLRGEEWDARCHRALGQVGHEAPVYADRRGGASLPPGLPRPGRTSRGTPGTLDRVDRPRLTGTLLVVVSAVAFGSGGLSGQGWLHDLDGKANCQQPGAD